MSVPSMLGSVVMADPVSVKVPQRLHVVSRLPEPLIAAFGVPHTMHSVSRGGIVIVCLP